MEIKEMEEMPNKYESYAVKINYVNGDTEEVSYEGINTTSHKEMINLYNDVKTTYNDITVRTIDFIGKTKDGTLKIFFTKEINTNKENQLRANTVDLSNNIRNSLAILKQKMLSHKATIPAIDKKLDVINHRLELLDDKVINEEEKLREKTALVNEIIKLRRDRRWHKNELMLINRLIEQDINGMELNLTHLINIFGVVEHDTSDYKYLDWDTASSLLIYEEIPYINDEDGREKKNTLKNKGYSNVIINKFDKLVIGYNNSKAVV